MKLISKEAQNANIIAAILNNTQQPGCIFVMSFGLRDFVQMASKEAFNYTLGYGCSFCHIILSQRCSKLQNDGIEDSEVDNCLDKIHFADLVKDAKSDIDS